MAVKKTTKEPTTMEELLAQSGVTLQTHRQGEKLAATVTSIAPKAITFNIGGKSEGVLIGAPLEEVKEYTKSLKVGDKVDAIVLDPDPSDGMVRLSLRHTASDSVWERLKELSIDEVEVMAMGKSASDRGVTVDILGILGFIPASHIGKNVSGDLSKLVGVKFPVKIVEVDKKRRRIIASERAVSEADEIQLQSDAIAAIKEGEIYDGEVVQITNFGAFVAIKTKVDKKEVPVEGLVHVSELSWEKNVDPRAVLKEGESVKVKVLGTKDGKLALSMKEMTKDPWLTITEKYTVESKITGKVTRSTSFGVFVELEPGIEGLIHMTKIPPATHFEVGDTVNCYIEEIVSSERKIALGLVLTAKPVGYK